MPGFSQVSDEVVVERYGIEFRGLIIQGVRTGRLYLARPGDTMVLKGVLEEGYCRWHSGPLDVPDNPMERTYCLAKVRGGADYCRAHARSERALYMRCMSGAGERSLGACRELDRRITARYVVYLLDYGDVRLKVGSSREFRWVERISEQPHIAATKVAVTDSALAARTIERRVSRLGGFSERPRKRLLRSSLFEAVSRLRAQAERVSRILGGRWDQRVVVVEGVWSVRQVRVEELEGVWLRLVGYSYGFLLFEWDNSVVGVRGGWLYHRTLWEWVEAET